MARAYVLQHVEKWAEAGILFAKVAKLVPDDIDVGLRAKEEHAWCIFQAGDIDAGIIGLKSVLDILGELEEREEDKARCLWRLGKVHWALNGQCCKANFALTSLLTKHSGENRDEAYKLFISALKSNPTYAPAFTSLGIYYTEHISPPDPIRASKCFQKAFELDPREAYAARRLAEGFAEEREWDLVEVVAKRTIEGEGGLSAGLQDSGRYLPTNAWAWKAVGVVELVQDFCLNFDLCSSSLELRLGVITPLRFRHSRSRSGPSPTIHFLGSASEKPIVRLVDMLPPLKRLERLTSCLPTIGYALTSSEKFTVKSEDIKRLLTHSRRF